MLRKKPKEDKRAPRRESRIKVKKDCVFCKNDLDIDYKNIELLERYISSRGKILSRNINGNCAKHQRKVAREIKRARFLDLVPYTGRVFS